MLNFWGNSDKFSIRCWKVLLELTELTFMTKTDEFGLHSCFLSHTDIINLIFGS